MFEISNELCYTCHTHVTCLFSNICHYILWVYVSWNMSHMGLYFQLSFWSMSHIYMPRVHTDMTHVTHITHMFEIINAHNLLRFCFQFFERHQWLLLNPEKKKLETGEKEGETYIFCKTQTTDAKYHQQLHLICKRKKRGGKKREVEGGERGRDRLFSKTQTEDSEYHQQRHLICKKKIEKKGERGGSQNDLHLFPSTNWELLEYLPQLLLI